MSLKKQVVNRSNQSIQKNSLARNSKGIKNLGIIYSSIKKNTKKMNNAGADVNKTDESQRLVEKLT